MKVRLSLAFYSTMLLVAGSGRAQAQDTPDTVFLVKNNTTVSLRCRAQIPRRGWSEWFRIAPRDEWTEETERPHAPGRIYCLRPVRQTLYAIRAGERYVMLRSRSSQGVILQRVDAD